MAAFAPTAESACWPDAVAPRRVVLDDVSRLNACEHAAVAQPRTVADVQAALARARGLWLLLDEGQVSAAKRTAG